MTSYEKLPVFQHADEILKAIDKNDVTILAGDTGCGKSTGIGHLIFKRAIKNRQKEPYIVITQPRRVAAVSLADRVATTMKSDFPDRPTSVGGLVGYKVRHDSKVSKATRVLYITDGLFMREVVQQDQSSLRYNYIVIDEAHERSIRIDLIMGLLKLRLTSASRNRPKLIIMSATMDLENLIRYWTAGDKLSLQFIEIPGRAFPVTTLYTTRSCSDVITAATATTIRVLLETKDKGDILLFLPGVEDINAVIEMLRRILEEFKEARETLSSLMRAIQSEETRQELPTIADREKAYAFLKQRFGLPIAALHDAGLDRLKEILRSNREAEVCLVGRRGDLEDQPANLHSSILNIEDICNVTILPLHAGLTSGEQKRVFEATIGRKIIVATNIAETSVTLAGVRYVIDSGLVKQRRGDSLQVEPITKAMAKQRSGRAGRVMAGMTFRLFTEEDYEKNLEDQNVPELLRSHLADYILNLLLMYETFDSQARGDWTGHTDLTSMVLSYPVPNLPDENSVNESSKYLDSIKAISYADNNCPFALTAKGKMLAALPLPVVWGNCIVDTVLNDVDCVSDMIIIVGMCSNEINWFSVLSGGEASEKIAMARKRLLNPNSDHVGFLQLYWAWKNATDRKHFCRLLAVDQRNFQKADLIINQLRGIILNNDLFVKRLPNKTIPNLTHQLFNGLIDKQTHYDRIAMCLFRALSLNVAVKQTFADADKAQATTASVYINTHTKDKLIIHPASSMYLFKTARPQ